MREKMKTMGIALAVTCLVLGFISQSAGADILEEVFKRTAFVNMEKVFQEYEKKKDFELKLKQETETGREKLEKMRQQLESLKGEYEKQEPLLAEEAKKERQQEINEKIKAIESFRQKLSKKIETKQNQYTQDILEDIIDKVQEVAKRGGYIYIFDKAALIYGVPPQDITEKIITELNKEYEKGENE